MARNEIIKIPLCISIRQLHGRRNTPGKLWGSNKNKMDVPFSIFLQSWVQQEHFWDDILFQKNTPWTLSGNILKLTFQSGILG